MKIWNYIGIIILISAVSTLLIRADQILTKQTSRPNPVAINPATINPATIDPAAIDPAAMIPLQLIPLQLIPLQLIPLQLKMRLEPLRTNEKIYY